MIQDYFKIAWKNLYQRKTRSLLTIVGIFLAIVTIFGLVSLSLGLKDYVDEQFEMLGGNKFFVQPKGSPGIPGLQGAVQLTLDDSEIVEKVAGVGGVTYLAFENGKIEFKDDPARYYFVMGIPNDDGKKGELFFEAVDLDVDEGRMLKNGDRKKILIGYNYKYRNLFSNPVVSGSKLDINGVEFEVVGVLEAIGNPSDDQQVYIPLDDLKEIFGTGDRVDMIWVEIEKGADLEQVAEKTEKRLKQFRNVDDKTIDFTVETPQEMIAMFNDILNILLAFLIGIGSISIIVGGIGIANTMYTSVLERNKEIGTMKAIGAKNSDILLIFVIESGVLGLIGGGLGLLVGIGIAKSIEYVSTVMIFSNIIRSSMNPYLLFGVFFKI